MLSEFSLRLIKEKVIDTPASSSPLQEIGEADTGQWTMCLVGEIRKEDNTYYYLFNSRDISLLGEGEADIGQYRRCWVGANRKKDNNSLGNSPVEDRGEDDAGQWMMCWGGGLRGGGE